MTDLPGLLERVKKCEGPDRRLDTDIDQALFGGDIEWSPTPIIRRPNPEYVGCFVLSYVSAYTASIDAALGLVERVLPKWQWSVYRNVHETGAQLAPGYGLWEKACVANIAPLALLAALLTALIANPDLARVKV